VSSPELKTPPNALPLLVGVVLDGADGADARVVEEDVDAAQRGGRGLHGGAYRGVVADISLESEQRPWHAGRFEVERPQQRPAGPSRRPWRARCRTLRR
jgi:hypothetical protein